MPGNPPARFPNLPFELGRGIRSEENHVFSFHDYELVTFPVKHVWWEPADLKLIARSARELLKVIETEKIREPIYLPRPGCGNGRQDWRNVKAVLAPILTSNQIHIVTYGTSDTAK